jgi:hypothetical protein
MLSSFMKKFYLNATGHDVTGTPPGISGYYPKGQQAEGSTPVG